MKHVLMIVPFFPPNAGGGVHRPLAFVKYLESYGWRATVVTPRAGAFWITDPTLLDDVPESCDVHRTRSFSGQALLAATRGRRRPQVRSTRRFSWLRKLGSMLLVPDTYIGWYPFAVAAGARILRKGKYDAIYSTSPPETSHLIARNLHRRSGLPWVADFRDPWMNLHLFPPPTLLHRRLHRRLERSVCENARVVVTSRWHEQQLSSTYPAMTPAAVIGNGYDHRKLERYEAVQPPPDRFVMLHAGMLTQQRSAAPLLEGLKLFLDEKPDARILVRFVGPRESGNDAAAERLGIRHAVEFRDTVPHGESLQLERASHILLLVKHSSSVYRGIVPGKLFEYIGARRPILALVPDGEVKDIVTSLKRGEVAPLDDTGRIARAIALFYGKFEDGTLDQDYDLSVVAEYQREQRSAQLATLLDSVATT